MNHYFSENPEIKSQKRLIKYTIEGEKFELTTDNGVFSKAKVDFGTDLMLKTFIKLNKNSKFEGKSEFKVLDIGCGYGVVSVVMKAFYKGITLVSSDVNERALELTTENLEKYHAKNFEPMRAGKETIFKIYEQAYEHLNENGEFYCVIQTKHGAKSTQKKLEEIFGNCETVTIDGGYRIYRSKKEKI